MFLFFFATLEDKKFHPLLFRKYVMPLLSGRKNWVQMDDKREWGEKGRSHIFSYKGRSKTGVLHVAKYQRQTFEKRSS